MVHSLAVRRPPKVALVIPPSRYVIDEGIENLCPNFGVLSLASWLAARGVPPTVRDYGLRPCTRSVAEDLCQYDWVGITTTVDSFLFVRRLVRDVRASGGRHTRIVLGGSLLSSYGLTPDNWLFQSIPQADVGVIGPGEDALLELVQGREPGSIPNTIFRGGGACSVGKALSHPMRSMDDQPFVDPALDPELHERLLATRIVFYQSSWGCPFHCGFCFNPPGTEGAYSVERTLRDVERLRAAYSAQSLVFMDSTFTANRARAAELIRGVSSLGVAFSFTTRVDCLDTALLDASTPHCTEIFLGMESFAEGDLRRHAKQITSADTEAAVLECRERNIIPRGFFILGLPGQTPRSLWRTAEAVERLRIPAKARVYIPLPGTVIYRNARAVDDLALLTWLARYSDTVTAEPPGWFNMSSVPYGELVRCRDRINEAGSRFLREARAMQAAAHHVANQETGER